MKRTLSIALAAGLLVGMFAMPAEAKKKKKPAKPVRVERVAESRYEAPALGSGAGACLVATNSCGNIAVGAGEVFVMIEIADSSGQAVFGSVGQDLDGDGTTDTTVEFCGSTTEPVAITPGVPLTIYPWAVGGPDCPGVATQGTVTATLSNLP